MKTVKRIMLIHPFVTRPKDFSAKIMRVSVFLPLGIAYLAAVIEERGGYELEVLDALNSDDLEEGVLLEGSEYIRYGLTDKEVEKRIKDFSPDVVGVACLFSAMYEDALNTCKIIKEVSPNIKTVMGGTHAGLMAEKVMTENDEVDFVIVGEAEKDFLSLLEAIEADAGFLNVNGLAFRQAGSVKFIPKTKYIENLDSIPFPSRHLFDMNKYFKSAKSHGFFKNTPYTQVITSRGCPYRCNFCALGAHWGSRQRMRSAKNVLDEIESLIKNYGIKEIHFEDDNLTADKKRAIEMFDGMVEREFDISWHVPSGIAVNTLDDEIIEKMGISGCYSIALAIESGNQEVVTKLMNKPVNLKAVPNIIKKIRKAGMDARGYFIIGYPGETKENIQQTVDFARSLELDWAYFSIASPLPNTKMYKTCIEKGYIKEEDFDAIRSFHRSIIRTSEFDPEYLNEVREDAIINVCFRNNPNLLKYNVDRAIEDFKNVVNHYPHFDFANFYLGEAYLKKGDVDKALDYYRRTLAVNPLYNEAKQRLADYGVGENYD